MTYTFSAVTRERLTKAILCHARACHPEECCGLIIRTPDGHQYLPCINASADPCQHFLIAPEDYLSASAAGTIIALVHSHPDGPPELSPADKAAMTHSACSWWLVCEGQIYCFGAEDENEHSLP
ncbi:C40 family peptidase [Pantoea sp. GL120224-02]|uniref:C40 family peptidase n=1 Tax=Pantoea sp. GL120224-02 TaxID=1378084 RepID=UPI000BDCAFA0|nr:C40 family peptidase [Pantoea sp. GL120224-02]SNY70869.1 Proteasome lid subunit RPN8/RPN11, contains Jab1/MPN metalloenzyme (JAMM) motif [Pantoea sp. GL120224-02]